MSRLSHRKTRAYSDKQLISLHKRHTSKCLECRANERQCQTARVMLACRQLAQIATQPAVPGQISRVDARESGAVRLIWNQVDDRGRGSPPHDRVDTVDASR